MEFMELLDKRRSFRALDPVEIDDDMVEDLMRSASRAPSCNNNQPWRFIFVREPEEMEKLKGTLSRGNYWAKRASMVIAVISRPDLDCRGDEGDYNLLDTGMALSILLLRATELGLATHPIAGFDHEEARKVLKIPEDYQLLPLVIVGRRSNNLGLLKSDQHRESELTASKRKSPDETMSMEVFDFRGRI